MLANHRSHLPGRERVVRVHAAMRIIVIHAARQVAHGVVAMGLHQRSRHQWRKMASQSSELGTLAEAMHRHASATIRGWARAEAREQGEATSGADVSSASRFEPIAIALRHAPMLDRRALPVATAAGLADALDTLAASSQGPEAATGN